MPHVVSFFETKNEPNNSGYVHTKRDESMVCDQGSKILFDERLKRDEDISGGKTHSSVEKHTEVFSKSFTIDEVIRSKKKEPRNGSEPGQSMDSVDSVTNGNDFLETFDLNSKCSECQSKWSHPYQPSKECNHDKCENTPDNVIFPPEENKYRFLKPFIVILTLKVVPTTPGR